MADSNASNPPPVDPMTAFWRDVWARSAAAMPQTGVPNMSGMPGMPGIPGMGAMDPATVATFFSPETMRRMQATFYEAMAQHAEQYMRSPQFLEAMKRSMDQALQMRRQMDDFLKSNMATAFETASGGASTEILGAIRQSTSQLQAHIDQEIVQRIDRLESRVADLEASVTGKPASEKSTKPTSGSPAASASSKKPSKG